ncbi:hypothetical protein AGLY_008282 [Aphis glycines]|uniref:Uncharacterized protein n=1 Tax=Aphis glycines TaxID=307491 RepID=A0A6G0TNN5_APHGL|nr:hypothetical protein AGLY_008282 [Aphis glycines]
MISLFMYIIFKTCELGCKNCCLHYDDDNHLYYVCLKFFQNKLTVVEDVEVEVVVEFREDFSFLLNRESCCCWTTEIGVFRSEYSFEVKEIGLFQSELLSEMKGLELYQLMSQFFEVKEIVLFQLFEQLSVLFNILGFLYSYVTLFLFLGWQNILKYLLLFRCSSLIDVSLLEFVLLFVSCGRNQLPFQAKQIKVYHESNDNYKLLVLVTF